MYLPSIGVPGVATERRGELRCIRRSAVGRKYLSQGVIINGSLSRDSGNTGYLDVLRPGLLVGKVTATGLWAPAILGITTAAYTSGGTSVTVSAAQATEIVRRVGTSGNLYYIGPPTANGTNAVSASLAYSAINTSTGVITTANIGADKVAGTLVVATDGTHVPRGFIDDGEGVKVTDDLAASMNVSYPHLLIGGEIDSSQMLPAYPSDTSIQAWIKDQLNNESDGGAAFTFDDYYGG